MAWRVVGVVLAVVFMALVFQATLAEPVVQVQSDLNESGDYNNEHFNGNDLIMGWIDSFFNVILILVFGALSWGVWYVLRREVTRGRL